MSCLRRHGISEDTQEEEMTHDFNLPRSELEHLIDEWIFHERDRKIIKRRGLAEEFDLSVRQVKNIVYKCETKLFKHIHF